MAWTNVTLSSIVFVLFITGHLQRVTSTSLRAAGGLRVTDGKVGVSEDTAESVDAQDNSPSQVSFIEDGMHSQNFADASNEMEASALIKRVQKVQTLAATQEFAVQEQQQALVGLAREQEILASRLAALSAPSVDEKDIPKEEAEKREAALESAEKKEGDNMGKDDEKEDAEENPEEKEEDKGKDLKEAAAEGGEEGDEKTHFLCSPQTAMTCTSWHGFGGDDACKAYGEATCDGKDEKSKCVCKTGFCADGHGNCKNKTAARLLPGTHGLELHAYPDKFLHLQSETKMLDFGGGDLGHSAHWHIVVNTDNTFMLYTKEYGPDHFMSVVAVDGDKSDMEAESTQFSSPREASFEVYRDEKRLVYFKDVHTGLWLSTSHKLGGNKVLGTSEFPGKSGAIIFQPPLPEDIQYLSSAQRIWALLPFFLLAVSAFG